MTYFLSIFFGTFLLEDLALASSIALMAENKIGFGLAFLACFLGISIGDIGLYLIGYCAAIFRFENRSQFLKRHRAVLARAQRSSAWPYSIVISRIIPGTRLPTYLAAGFLKYPLLNFVLLTAASVGMWVVIALLGGRSLHVIFMNNWIISLAAFLIFLHLLKTIVPKVADRWQRKALWHSWRRWQHFEFWPSWFFYIPIVPYYLFLSLRYRNLFMPFFANPHLKHGGLIGESKWDFLKHLEPSDSTTLAALKISKDLDFSESKTLIESYGFEYPFIIKPDVGQRGFGVRIINNDYELTEYLLLSDFERIVQRLSNHKKEAGVFYVRPPSETVGYIFSITDKKFPFVIGDGQTSIGNLILQNRRARIIAPVYFARHKDQLETIPLNSETFLISECGNHCQGAIFQNGNHLNSERLKLEIDRIAKKIPDFYFGRFDIRYKDHETLMQGTDFEIVEINGSGSEATHIWDESTKLVDAYATLYAQWKLLFEIGAAVKKQNRADSQIKVLSFLKDCLSVAIRKSGLSVSS